MKYINTDINLKYIMIRWIFLLCCIHYGQATCQAGKYVVWPGNRGCRNCQAGRYQSSDDVTWNFCLECLQEIHSRKAKDTNVGYSSVGASSCSASCPANTYHERQACVDTCSNGRYVSVDSNGGKHCKQCYHGMYLDQSLEQPECKHCTAGKYSNDQRTVCVNCAAGYYTEQVAIERADLCSSAPARACAAGKYSETEGATSEDVCVYCPVGKYQSGIGMSACNDCYEEKTTGVPSGATRCDIDCPNNGYSIIDGYCTKCPEGKYLNASNGDTACKDCPNTLEDQRPNSDGVSCFTCLPGHARSSCEKCPPGRYTGWEAVDECHQCGQGYQDEHGQGNCKQCPAGRVSSTDNTTCVTCPVGEYSDEVDLITCKTCPSGYQHTGIIGQKDSTCTSENTIGKHTYSASDNEAYKGFQESLNEVAAGTYTAETTSCSANSYKNTFGGTCKACPQGLYNDKDDPSIKIVGINDWANLCKFCPAGEVYTGDTCTKCPFLDNKCILRDYPSEECRYAACPDGSSALDGECSECPAGTYWESTETIGLPFGLPFDLNYVGIFHECEQFETQFERPDLVTGCNSGKEHGIQFCSYLAANSQIACQRGALLSTATGTYTGLCRQCPLGQYQDLPGQVTCKDCSGSTSKGSASCSLNRI